MKPIHYVIGLAVIAGLAGAYVVFSHNTPSTPSTPTTTTDGVSTTGSSTVTDITPRATPTAPSLTRATVFSPSLSAATKARLTTDIAGMVTRLKANSLDAEAWLYLGTYRKMAGDYTGAAEAWLYVQQISPKDPISAANLGDLYMHFTPDYPKAEHYLNVAITLEPHAVRHYVDLYELYRDLYKKNTTLAHETLVAGLSANPDDAQLKALLSEDAK